MLLSEVDWLTTSQVIECDWCDVELTEESNDYYILILLEISNITC